MNKFYVLLLSTFIFYACAHEEKKPEPKPFVYETFRDSLRQHFDTTGDSSNIFDGKEFTPGKDSLEDLLEKIDTAWHRDSVLMSQFDTMIHRLRTDQKFSAEEKLKIKQNLHELDSFLLAKNDSVKTTCSKMDCRLYAEVIKSTQTLYLYLEGELKDSFKVSTGMKGYETPVMDLRPNGPVFTKYTSKKFPGGNYKGLGNMPYAVFLKGGYAIHGTTPGNFVKLGRKASHGCVRIHPDNALIFSELVKLVGLENTWVTIREKPE